MAVDKNDGDEAYSGTLLVRGKSYLEATRTGRSSAMGRLATMLTGIQAGKTPLERRVDQLGRQIARWVLGLAAALGVAGVLAEGLGRAPEIIVFAVALAVAAVPEGLPAVLTVALALGTRAHGPAARRRPATVRGRGARLGHGDRDRQDRDADREPMDFRTLDASDLPRCLRRHRPAQRADLPPVPAILWSWACCDMRRPGAWTSRGCATRSPHRCRAPFDSAWKFARVTVEERGQRVSLSQGRPRGHLRAARCRRGSARRGPRSPPAMPAKGFGSWPSPGARGRRKNTCPCSDWCCSGIRRGRRCRPPSPRRGRRGSAS